MQRLQQLFPVAECALYHTNAFQLLVATILSAQCTDERVNKSTPELFRRFPDAAALAAFEHVASPARVINLAGPDILDIAQVSQQFGEWLGRRVQLVGVPDSQALALHEALLARLPGYLVPKLVREIAGAASKRPVP